MNIFELDSEKNKLLVYLSNEKSPRNSLLAIKEFIDKAKSFNDANVLSAFLTDLMHEYVSCLNQFEPFGLQPSITEKIIEQLEEIIQLGLFNEYENELKNAETDLKNQVDELKNILNGDNTLSADGHGLIFPVIEKGFEDDKYGLLDNLTITIKHNSKLTKNEFIVIPSQKELELKLKKQIETSWNVAVSVAGKYKKLKGQSLEIIIKFKKKYANYEGYSLGAALTIGFIQTLLQHYETREIISLKNNTALTGGINENGDLIPVSDDVIKKKVETVFYSNIEKFIIPDKDKNAAETKLAELNSLYPKRKLEIIAVSSLNDLLDRRRLVDVKKQNMVRWSAKKVVKNKYAYVFFFLFLSAISFMYLKEVDNNPVNLEYVGNSLLVKNKMGKVFWEKKIKDVVTGMLSSTAQLYDVNNDGVNEIFLCNETQSSLKDKNSAGRLVSLDSEGNLIWQCKFSGNVHTENEVIKDRYSIHSIFGFIEREGRTELIVAAKHYDSFASAIFKVDAETGKIIGNILWHPGLISYGTIYDLDGDGKNEIIAVCIVNGFEASSLLIVEEDKIFGRVPSAKGYNFLDLPKADVESYIIFPKTDLTDLFNKRYNKPNSIPNINAKLGSFNISFLEGGKKELARDVTLQYEISFDLSEINPIISDRFRTIRDKQIKSGKLNLPLSDTNEYRNLLKSKLLILKNGKFVHFYP